MLSSILRGKEGRRRSEQDPLMSPHTRTFTTPRSVQQARRRDADFDDRADGEESEEQEEVEEEEEDAEDEEDDGLTPLLPIFEAAQLGWSSALFVVQVR